MMMMVMVMVIFPFRALVFFSLRKNKNVLF